MANEPRRKVTGADLGEWEGSGREHSPQDNGVDHYKEDVLIRWIKGTLWRIFAVTGRDGSQELFSSFNDKLYWHTKGGRLGFKRSQFVHAGAKGSRLVQIGLSWWLNEQVWKEKNDAKRIRVKLFVKSFWQLAARGFVPVEKGMNSKKQTK